MNSSYFFVFILENSIHILNENIIAKFLYVLLSSTSYMVPSQLHILFLKITY